MKVRRLPTRVGFFALALLLPAAASAQALAFLPSGLGAELGAGHNQLRWTARGLAGKTIDGSRLNFFLTPHARISFNRPVLKGLHAMPFLGYDEFGGRSEEEPDGYRDHIRFRALEAGLLGLYGYRAVQVGGGVKLNRHLAVTQRAYGSYGQASGTRREWSTHDFSSLFRKWSVDAGLRLEWRALPHVVVGGESWFGLVELQEREYDRLDVRQNRFRVLVGYRL